MITLFNSKKKVTLSALLIVCLSVFITARTTTNPSLPASKAPDYPVDVASSIWVVVNKGRQLPASYQPSPLVIPSLPLRYGADSPQMQLRADAAAELAKMVARAKKDNISLMLASGYRSYASQAETYHSEVVAYGQAVADQESARPGFSEHQTGLAADLEPLSHQCEVQDCFANTAEGVWLAKHSSEYGYIIRYKKDQQNLTGYKYEPWHIRYVGPYLAAKLAYSNQTLEQFFKLPRYSDYAPAPLQLKLN